MSEKDQKIFANLVLQLLVAILKNIPNRYGNLNDEEKAIVDSVQGFCDMPSA